MTRLLTDIKAVFPRVDTVDGWQTRGAATFAPAAVVCHWTAGPRAAALTKRPSLRVVTDGRPELSGPLCNVYLDRAGIPVIVAAGRANHAGAGGWKGVVGNSAAYGIEAEAADGQDWTPAQRIAYPKLVAAMLRGLGRDASWCCGHYEWATPPGRKSDITGWTMTAFRAQVADHLKHPTTNTEDELTPDEKALLANIGKAVTAIYDTVTPGQTGVKFDGQLYTWIRDTPLRTWQFGIGGLKGVDASGKPTYGDVPAWQRLGNVDGKTDAAALLALFRAALGTAVTPSAPGGTVDPAALAKAVSEALKPVIAEAVKSAPSASPDAVAKSVADVLAARLAS